MSDATATKGASSRAIALDADPSEACARYHITARICRASLPKKYVARAAVTDAFRSVVLAQRMIEGSYEGRS